jgi:hypothetical protein
MGRIAGLRFTGNGIFYSVKTDMNQSCSLRNHENYSVMRVPRLRASPRHGGAKSFSAFLLRYLIRRGGAPSGAAEFIVMKIESGVLVYLN